MLARRLAAENPTPMETTGGEHKKVTEKIRFNLGFNKRVRMPNPQLQKDILILHLLITTTDSNQNHETHNLARTC